MDFVISGKIIGNASWTMPKISMYVLVNRRDQKRSDSWMLSPVILAEVLEKLTVSNA